MKHIASRDNPFFRQLRQWTSDAAARREAGIAVLEGIHLADACVRSGVVPRHVVVGVSALDGAEVVDLLDRIDALVHARLDAHPDAHVERTLLDDALFANLSQLAQGVTLLTIVDRPAPVAPARIERTSVLLDRLQDPGNVGSILRSAAAAGVEDVYLSPECAGAWSPKVLRAAMGAHFHLRLFEDCDLVAAKATAAVPWIATSPHADRTIHDIDLRVPVAWVFGHEGQGVAPALTDGAVSVRIPQPGHGESLNVAASAAICLFEQVRQQRA